MKYSLILILSLFCLTSCTKQSPLSPSERIVDISDSQSRPIGKGVLATQDTIMTARHVYDVCGKSECRYSSSIFGALTPTGGYTEYDGQDKVVIEIRGVDRDIPENIGTPEIGASISALISRSGALERITGKILALDRSYIGYDQSLSGRRYSSGIETDILLERGESGTPLWSLSGELIGIMSAIDREGKRGWGVR